VHIKEVSELISRVALHDRNAFRQLYKQTSPKLLAVCLRILRDRGEAEDALQEVFIKIWHNAPKFRVGGYSPMSWLIAIARNHAIDRIRARDPAPADIAETQDLASDDIDPEESAIAVSERARIDACLDELKAGRAEAVRSAYIEGYSYQDLAQRYGLPLNTLRTWLRRSLISLKECLER
jgi:RNA polymerase sigma-70 factor (ECF subfamily)